MKIGLVIAATLATFAGLAMSQTPRPPKTFTVEIRLMQFVPPSLGVNTGDTIIWKNEDIVPHTVTSGENTFDSGEIKQGKSWTYIARTKGSHAYICRYHPTMKGVLVH